MNVFTPVFNAFRFYENGTEDGAAALANQDTNVSVDVSSGDVIVTLRVRIQETGGADGATTDDYTLQRNHNGAGYGSIAGSGTITRDDPTNCSLAHGSATTNRATDGITDGTGSFVAGEQSDTAGAGNLNVTDHQLTASNFTEHVYGFELISADLADGDTLDFRITLNGGTPGMTNSVTPRITVVKSAGLFIDADAGSYALTGSAAALEHDQLLDAGGGSYAITGQDATLNKGLTLAAEAGSYAISGQDATFNRNRVVEAGAGSYALNGSTAGLELGRQVVAEGGSYALTGQDAALNKGLTLVADTGSYVMTGSAAGLEWARRIVAEAGSYALSGTDADLVLASSLELTSEAGSYLLTGSDADLEYTPLAVEEESSGGVWRHYRTPADLRRARERELAELEITELEQRRIDRTAAKIARVVAKEGLNATAPIIVAQPAFDALLMVLQPSEGMIQALAQAIVERIIWAQAMQQADEESALMALLAEI